MTRPPAEKTGPARLAAAWRALAREQRLVVVAAVALLASMLLPWYSRSVDAVVRGQLETASSSKLAITVFSFVEAAIFLVAVGVTLLVLARGDRRAFHLPGGDGAIVTAAGAWATFLIFFRFVDKPGGGSGGQLQVEYGLSWGIFFGLLAALALAAAGLRLRAAQLAEPALPGDVAPSDGPSGAPGPRGPAGAGDPTRIERREERAQRRRAGAPLDADEAPTWQAPPAEAPTRQLPPDEAPTSHAAPAEATPRGPEPLPGFEPPEFEPPPRRRPDRP